MSEFDRFADGLADEVLSEMADTFFGSRREMDEQIEHFHKLSRELRKLGEQAERFAEILHFVLLGEEGAAAFYEAIGLDPAVLPFCLECTTPPVLDSLPFAFTFKGRFRKLLAQAYSGMRDNVEDYLHGHEYADPDEPRRRRTSVNYRAMKRLERRLNMRIDKMNGECSLSNALQYMRGLDPAQLEREKIAGTPAFVPEGGLDASFKYPQLDMEAEGLQEFPEMPPLSEVRNAIRDFAAEFYARNRKEVRSMLRRLREAGRKG